MSEWGVTSVGGMQCNAMQAHRCSLQAQQQYISTPRGRVVTIHTSETKRQCHGRVCRPLASDAIDTRARATTCVLMCTIDSHRSYSTHDASLAAWETSLIVYTSYLCVAFHPGRVSMSRESSTPADMSIASASTSSPSRPASAKQVKKLQAQQRQHSNTQIWSHVQPELIAAIERTNDKQHSDTYDTDIGAVCELLLTAFNKGMFAQLQKGMPALWGVSHDPPQLLLHLLQRLISPSASTEQAVVPTASSLPASASHSASSAASSGATSTFDARSLAKLQALLSMLIDTMTTPPNEQHQPIAGHTMSDTRHTCACTMHPTVCLHRVCAALMHAVLCFVSPCVVVMCRAALSSYPLLQAKLISVYRMPVGIDELVSTARALLVSTGHNNSCWVERNVM